VTYSLIETERDGSVLVVRLNRPDKLNAFTLDMHHELLRLYDEADADNDVRVIVVTGNGRAFCAGADLSGVRGDFAYGDDPNTATPVVS